MSRVPESTDYPHPLALRAPVGASWPWALTVQSLDRLPAKAHTRDEISISLRQRTTGSGLHVTLDLRNAAEAARWLESGNETVLSMHGSGPYQDILTLVRETDRFDGVDGLTIALFHRGGFTQYREVFLPQAEADKVTAWLGQFWRDGLPGVPRRRPDESAEEFAARRVKERRG